MFEETQQTSARERENTVGRRTKDSRAGTGETRRPVVVVDDLHVKYQVYSSGKSVGTAGADVSWPRPPVASAKSMPSRVFHLSPMRMNPSA